MMMKTGDFIVGRNAIFERTWKLRTENVCKRVCELLLRLQANYLCPAMHDASMAFHRIPEKSAVVDSFAIVMGSSHCEPLLFNTTAESKRDKMGEWDYINNKEGVNKGVEIIVADECAPFENVYTPSFGMRGLHDRAMNASNNMDDRKKMFEEALMAQRTNVGRC